MVSHLMHMILRQNKIQISIIIFSYNSFMSLFSDIHFLNFLHPTYELICNYLHLYFFHSCLSGCPCSCLKLILQLVPWISFSYFLLILVPSIFPLLFCIFKPSHSFYLVLITYTSSSLCYHINRTIWCP